MLALGLLAALFASVAPAALSPSAQPAASPAAQSATSPAPLITPAAVDGLTVAAIEAKARAARGTAEPVKSDIRVWKIHQNALDGTIREVSRGEDWVDTRTLGPFVTAYGSLDGTYWRQNENGIVLITPAIGETRLGFADQQSDAEIVSESLQRVHAPVDAYLIETKSAAGTSYRTFYDPATFLVVRREETKGSEHIFATFSDYVTNAAGRTFPRHQAGSDDSGNGWDRQLVAEDLTTPVTAADVAIPKDRRTLVEFPQGKTTVRLPARIDHGLIVVRVQIGGKGFDFILDSGSHAIAIDNDAAQQLGLALYGKATATIAGAVAYYKALVPEMQIGELRLHDVAVEVVPLPPGNIDNETKSVGLLGFDFLRGAAFAIDYDRGTVDATAPDAFVPPSRAAMLETSLMYEVPEIPLALGPQKGARFVIDTGAQEATIVIFPRFFQMHDSQFSPGLKRGDAPKVETLMVGGRVDNSLVKISDLTVGPWTFVQVNGLFVRSPLSFATEDGLIGSQFLSSFTVTIDEPHARLYLHSDDPDLAIPAPAPDKAR